MLAFQARLQGAWWAIFDKSLQTCRSGMIDFRAVGPDIKAVQIFVATRKKVGHTEPLLSKPNDGRIWTRNISCIFWSRSQRPSRPCLIPESRPSTQRTAEAL